MKVREILKGQRELDLLNGTIWDKILLYALPLAATGILQQLFNAADVAVVGTYVGKNAMGAVGSNSAVIGLLVNFFVGISLGANVIISQFIGQNNKEGIYKAVHTSVIVALIGGVVVSIFGEMMVKWTLAFLAVPEEMYNMARLYLRIYLMGLPVIFLYNFESAIFRSEGDTKTPLFVLTFSGVLNVALNLLLVRRFGMTVDGVAIATVTSNLVSSIILFILLCKSRTNVKINLHQFSFDSNILYKILRIGIPSGVQGMVFSLANICVQSGINSLGTDIVAASSAAFNVEILAYFILNSFGQACTTFVGQNYGAKQLNRCHKAVPICLLMDAICSVTAIAFILFFSQDILALFNKDPAVIYYGRIRLIYLFASYGFSLFIEVLSGYLRGFGLSFIPAAVSLICICGIRIMWVYSIFPLYRTFANLMLVYPISLGVTSVIIIICTLISRRRFIQAE